LSLLGAVAPGEPEESPPSAVVRDLGCSRFDSIARRLSMLGSILASAAVPVLWAVGIVLIIVGVISLFRRSMFLGAVLIIVGILLGGLNIFGVFN
jgi:hypothetical protein